jgi:rifampicin phosphotransferase
VIETEDAELQPYPDGTWWVKEHRVRERFPLVCRGNTGEVYPNVVSPITGSLVAEAFARGQCQLASEAGMATKAQLIGCDGVDTSLAPMFAGYIYSNVSMARSAVARMPGVTTDMVDRQMFGLSGAPAHRRGPGDRSVRAALRGLRFMFGLMLRPDLGRLDRTRQFADDGLAQLPEVAHATDAELVEIMRGVETFGERMMYELIRASAGAGVGRSMLERLVAEQGGDELVNRLTGGLGTIESAEPAFDLWRLGRIAAGSSMVTQLFDDRPEDLLARLREADDAAVRVFVAEFEGFLRRHGSRGPEEWELEQPTWGTDPSIALAAIDRLRHAPAERDPEATARMLAHERSTLVGETRSSLPRLKRKAFDLALRAASVYSAHREGTKAAFVRLLDPPRLALIELARRSGMPHADLCLLTIDEIPLALEHPDALAGTIAERRARREYLQARIPPFWFEGEIPPPPGWELRRDRMRPDTTPRELTGLGVCPGVATGRARVILDPADPRELGPDDILVAPITDPSWTPLFLAAAGVVVDVGAQQSHAAIVARELGIPAVVSVAGASTTIPDGTLITVDGSNGRVTVHATT